LSMHEASDRGCRPRRNPPSSAARHCIEGEITGNKTCDREGTVEGWVQLDERKLNVGAAPSRPADIIALKLWSTAPSREISAPGPHRDKKDGSVTATHHRPHHESKMAPTLAHRNRHSPVKKESGAGSFSRTSATAAAVLPCPNDHLLHGLQARFSAKSGAGLRFAAVLLFSLLLLQQYLT